MALRVRRAALLALVLLSLQVAAIVAVLGADVGTASAHANVVSTDPADDTSVATGPERVSITFSEPVSTSVGGLTVRDGRGQRVDVGDARASGAVLSTGLRPDLPDGTYLATYRVLSADGHPVSGSFLFGVGSGTLDRSVGAASDDRTWETVGYLSRTALLFTALLAAGTAVFLGFVHDGAEDRWRLVPIVRIGTILALFAAVGLVMTQAAILTGRGAGASTDTGVLRSVLSGDLGRSLAVLLVGLVVVHLSTDVRGRTTARALAAYGGLAVTVSFALWGHATAFPAAWLLMATDAVHATAAALWLGGVVGLTVVLTTRRAEDVGSTAGMVGRFSTVALWSVIALVLAGTALALAGSDASWSDLVATTWGRLVLVKVVITGGIVALAAWNRRVLVPGIVGPGPTTSEPMRRLSLLRRTVMIEALAMVVVLAVTGALTEVAPARSSVTGSGDVSVTRPVDTGSLTLTVRPARVGSNTLDATYADATGQPVDVGNTMTIEFSLPTEGLAPLTRRTDAVSPGRFVYEGRELSMPGVWTVTLAVRTGVFAEQRTSFEVRVEP